MWFYNENKISTIVGPVEPGIGGKFGWGGRIRTFTIHINSVVSYRLDHAPAGLLPTYGPNKLSRLRRIGRGGGFF